VQEAGALLHRLGEGLRIGAGIAQILAGQVRVFVHADGEDVERAALVERAIAFRG